MEEYAGRVLADRYRLPLPPSDEFELAESRAFDTYSGHEVLVRQVPLPEVVDAEVVDGDGLAGAAVPRRAPGRATRRPTDPAVVRAVEAAQAAASLPDHPRLDQVFDVFAEDGSLWIVSEVVAARPLAALLAEKPLSPYRAAEVAADVLTALRVLHAHGWTHRNITVRTVLVCDDGRVVLTGLASGAAEEALCGYAPVPEPPQAAEAADGEVVADAHGASGAVELAAGPGSEGPARGGLPAPVRPAEAAGPPALPRQSGAPAPDVRAARAGAIAAYRAGARAAARVRDDERPGAGAAPDDRPVQDGIDPDWWARGPGERPADDHRPEPPVLDPGPTDAPEGGYGGARGSGEARSEGGYGRGAEGGYAGPGGPGGRDGGHGAHDGARGSDDVRPARAGHTGPVGRGSGSAGPGGQDDTYGRRAEGGYAGPGRPQGWDGGYADRDGTRGSGDAGPDSGYGRGGEGGYADAGDGPGVREGGYDGVRGSGDVRPARAGHTGPVGRSAGPAGRDVGQGEAYGRGHGGPGGEPAGHRGAGGREAGAGQAGAVGEARPYEGYPYADTVSPREDAGPSGPAEAPDPGGAPWAAGGPRTALSYGGAQGAARHAPTGPFGEGHDAPRGPYPAAPFPGGSYPEGFEPETDRFGDHRGYDADGDDDGDDTDDQRPGLLPPPRDGRAPHHDGHDPYRDGHDPRHDGPEGHGGGAPRARLAGVWHDGPGAGRDGFGPLPAGGGRPALPAAPPDPYRDDPYGVRRAAAADSGRPDRRPALPAARRDSGAAGWATGGDALRADAQRVPAPAGGPAGPPPGRWDEVAAPSRGGPGFHGPTTPLAAERARQARITVVGAVTERWAPEQAGPVHENWQLAAPVGPATDLWALGALLYRVVQGHAPYPEDSAAELVHLVCAEPPAFAEECGPLRPVVESLLRQDPTERPDVEELSGWLRSLVRSAPEPEAGTGLVSVPSGPVDPSLLPIVRRRGELVRRRRFGGRDGGHGRHKHRKGRGRGAGHPAPAPERSAAPRPFDDPRGPASTSRLEPHRFEPPRRPPKQQRRFTDDEFADERSPRGAGRGREPKALGRTILLVVLLALAAAVAYAVLFMPKAGEEPAGGAPGAAQRPSAGAGPSPDRTGPAPSPDGSPGSQQPQTSAPAADLPDGYVLREDAEGFRVAVDEDWRRSPVNDAGQVRYVGGDFTLIVVPGRDSVAENGDDPLTYQRDRERELRPFRESSWATASGLKRIDVGEQSMAEGQFTWQDSSGREVFVRNLALIVGDRYHVVQVIGPSDQREKVTEIHQQAAATYRVTR
ncbi:protein kinase [Streptomyces sp. NPDC005805]|uniref:protein kinase n=1 Tax=Streptomyces sp. NPDC005805 TaxID=3157068 RepID=UPI0033D52092